jgi:hypothetical protein
MQDRCVSGFYDFEISKQNINAEIQTAEVG